ncbi:PhzF family phenazine biosynthesis protein [Pseudomonadota bacterium]
MKIYKGRAFTSKEKIEGKKVIGNPASIVVCSKEFPDQKEMGEIAIKEKQPMTAFVKQNKNGEKFDIDYFAPNGTRFNLCGHATLVTAYFLNKLYGYQDLIFHLHHKTEELSSEFIQSSLLNNGIVRISIPSFIPDLATNEDCINNYTKAFNLDKKDVQNFYYCKELKDFIIVLMKKNKIRYVEPNLNLLSKTSKKHSIRGVFITSKSENKNIDYEIRIFAPHLGINEDISCCSANCSLLPLWSHILNIKNEKESQILCPYNTRNTGFGGLEFGYYDHKKSRIHIGGFVKEF